MTKANEQIEIGEKWLRDNDPILAKVITLDMPIRHLPRSDYFAALCQAIVSQQLSTKAAAVIFDRFKKLTKLDPLKVSLLTLELSREVGLSGQKHSYLVDLANHFINKPEIYTHLSKQTDEEIITELTARKGIGPWTAQMFLMFSLVRLDVFAPADLGIMKAISKLYNIERPVDDLTLIEISDKWRPYRTIACWYLWASLDN